MIINVDAQTALFYIYSSVTPVMMQEVYDEKLGKAMWSVVSFVM